MVQPMKLAAFLTILAFSTAGAASSQAVDQPVHATVESGELVGVAKPNADVFRNIPYAAPPVGDLRWKPPALPLPWTGVREAILPGPSCPQPMNPDGKPNLGAANGPTSEDCLQLNVFAPKAAKGAPVILWLHGGGHRTGAGWIYNGESFARDGVVFVAINYRLGALGYFAHPALTREAHGQPIGNYGLMDQIAALQWVKRNIATFGGDPANITIAGESAGGMSVLALLATPSGKGLYAKAIVQSGGGWSRPVTLAAKEGEGVAMMGAAGIPATATAAQLRALPVEKVTGQDADFGPFLDGRLMTETPAQAFARGHATDVPMIIGTNSGEDSLMGSGEFGPTAAHLMPPKVRAAYPPEAKIGRDALVRQAFTDRFMGAPARWIAAQAAGGQPAWLYYFSYVGSRFRPQMTRAAHAAELQYMLEYWGRRTPMSSVSEEDRAMAQVMHGCWVAFAKLGAPLCGDPPWPAYRRSRDQLLEFGSPTDIRTHFRKRQLDAQEAAALPGLKLK